MPSNAIQTGFSMLDELAPLLTGDLRILAARPSMGAGRLLLNTCRNASLSGVPVLYFSLQQSSESLGEPWLKVYGNDPKQMIRAAFEIGDAPFWANDTAGPSVAEIRAEVTKWLAEIHAPAALVVVDYLELVARDENPGHHAAAGSKRLQPYRQHLREVASRLKEMASALSLAVVLRTHLRRPAEQRTDNRPVLADLDPALIQPADSVCFVYRDSYYDRVETDEQTAEIIVAQQKNGPIGTARLAFRLRPHVHFSNLGEMPDWIGTAEESPAQREWRRAAKLGVPALVSTNTEGDC